MTNQVLKILSMYIYIHIYPLEIRDILSIKFMYWKLLGLCSFDFKNIMRKGRITVYIYLYMFFNNLAKVTYKIQPTWGGAKRKPVPPPQKKKNCIEKNISYLLAHCELLIIYIFFEHPIYAFEIWWTMLFNLTCLI